MDAVLIVVVLVLGVIPLAVRVRSLVSWLGAAVAVGGALSFVPSVVQGPQAASEVGRLGVLIGAAALAHLTAVLAGWRPVDSGSAGRHSIIVPATLYVVAFGGWIALELTAESERVRFAPTAIFLGVCAVALVTVVVQLARASASERTRPLPLLPGLVLLCVVGGASAFGIGRSVPASLFALAVLAGGLTWLIVGDELRQKLASGPGASRRFAGRGRTSLSATELACMLREVAQADDEADVASIVARGLERWGAELVALVAGKPDAALSEAQVPRDRAALAIEPADPLYVALREGIMVVSDEIDSSDGPAAARAAVHRLAGVGALVAAPLSIGDRFVGGMLVGSPSDTVARDVLDCLRVLGAPVGFAVESLRARIERRVGRAPGGLAALPLRANVGRADFHGIVGGSGAIEAVFAQIERVAPTDTVVFVRGETGTGKERVVEALHALSSRAGRELVKIPCAALPEPLLESELFGYEPGAFTGAVERKEGRFEVADGGTLFFDDVDTLPLGVQAKLLRALQEREVQRLGSNQVRRVDVRVVAATNRDLLAEVRAGSFREDLYYRLNVVPIELPPLRERKEDIAVLIAHFLELDGERLGRHVEGIEAASLAGLEEYNWPGNVRELRNLIMRALVMSEGAVLRVAVPSGNENKTAPEDPDGLGRASLPELLLRYKTRLVTRALEISGGNQRQAAEMLGIHRPSLTRMVRELGLRDSAVAKRSKKKSS